MFVGLLLLLLASCFRSILRGGNDEDGEGDDLRILYLMIGTATFAISLTAAGRDSKEWFGLGRRTEKKSRCAAVGTPCLIFVLCLLVVFFEMMRRTMRSLCGFMMVSVLKSHNRNTVL